MDDATEGTMPAESLRLYRTAGGCVVEEAGKFFALRNGASDGSWDAMITRDDLYDHLRHRLKDAVQLERLCVDDLKAPIGSQEVWGAGVTYHTSREARKRESKFPDGGDCYERVYDAKRPELFFKATPHRVVGPNEKVAVRHDSFWSVPEPELALLLTPNATVVGYTVGNDVSSRSLEGENPLYLPQAKIWDRSCALGPCLLISRQPLPATTEIRLTIIRDGRPEFSGVTSLVQMKRDFDTLVSYLFRHCSFPQGCFLLTGTGIVPPDSFSLAPSDEISISISGIGTLRNAVG
jgi:2-dehydro-3-deoxy-D-arabinonate dehydratase